MEFGVIVLMWIWCGVSFSDCEVVQCISVVLVVVYGVLLGCGCCVVIDVRLRMQVCLVCFSQGSVSCEVCIVVIRLMERLVFQLVLLLFMLQLVVLLISILMFFSVWVVFFSQWLMFFSCDRLVMQVCRFRLSVMVLVCIVVSLGLFCVQIEMWVFVVVNVSVIVCLMFLLFLVIRIWCLV